jgi:hypothetical protein
MTRPDFIPHDKRGLENTDDVKQPWSGPDASVIIGLAMKQPGAKARRHGIKFQCAGCVAEGHDKSRDNACVFNDGRFSCAVGGAAHRAAIAKQLNIPEVLPTPSSAPTGPFRARPPLDGPIAKREQL